MRSKACLSSLFAFAFATLFVSSCGGNSSGNSIKLQQYMVQGEALYQTHCSNCHQSDGTGLRKVYPPLKDSDYLESMSPAVLACQIRYGVSDTLVVNGVSYTMPMPGIRSLTALEVAEIVTFVDQTWGKKRGLYSVKEAERALDSCREARPN